MKLNIKDKLFIFAYLGLIGYALYMLAQVDESFRSSSESIAVVEKASGKLQGMGSGELAWKQMERGQKLGDGDRILTSDKSYATITFDDGLKLELEPKTLILLERRDVKVQSGTIKVSQTKGKRKSKIKVNGAAVAPAAVPVKLQAKPEPVPAATSEQEPQQVAAVEEPAPEIFLSAIECDSSKAKETAFELKHEQIAISEEQNYSSMILYDRRGKEIYQGSAVPRFDIPKALRSRIRSIAFTYADQGCEYTTVAKKLDLPELDPPKLALEMSWNEGTLMFTIQNSTAEQVFGPLLLEFLGADGGVLVSQNFAFGASYPYGLQVAPVNARVVLEDYRVPAPLDVQLPKLPAPRLQTAKKKLPREGEQILKEFQGMIEVRPLLAWGQVPGASKYQVRILLAGAELATRTTKNNRLIWPLDYRKGSYQYQVIPYDRFGNAGVATEIGTVELE